MRPHPAQGSITDRPLFRTGGVAQALRLRVILSVQNAARAGICAGAAEGSAVEISLLDVFESDQAGVLDLLRLAGLDPARRHSDLSLGRGAELHIVAAGAFAGLREHPLNERLEAVWDDLESVGWTLFEAPEQEPWRRWGPLLRPAEGMPRELAIEIAADALRVTFLWSAARALAAHWHGDGGDAPAGVCDLHRRPDAEGRPPALVTEAPEAVLAVVESRAPAIERATAILDLLPRLRSRLALILTSALELSGEDVVSVLCESCPEGAEVDSRRLPATAAQAQALASLRVQHERARQAIEDGLNQGDERLRALLERARTAPLPRGLAAAVVHAGAGRAGRRAEATARLLWLLRGESATPDRVDEDPVLVGHDLAASPADMPAGFEALAAAGDPLDLTLFLLRYAVHRHAHERPGRETLARLLPETPAGRAGGRAVASRLAASRRRVVQGLDRRDSDRPAPPGRADRHVLPNIDWSDARSPVAARLAFRQGLREEVGEPAFAGPARGEPKPLRARRRWTRWLSAAVPTIPLGFRPLPALGVGRGARVEFELPEQVSLGRPVLLRDGPDGVEMLLPGPTGPWPPGQAFGGTLTVEVDARPGEHRYLLVAGESAGAVPSIDELRRRIEQGEAQAWEARLDVR
jgi:hypothetical protein